MRYRSMFVLACAFCLSARLALGGAPVKIPYVIYADGEDEEGLYSPSGYMGSTDAIDMNPLCHENPHSGKSCIKVTFTDPNGWGGVVWQNPPNNWGDTEGGLNLTGAKQLTFWARGEKGGEEVEFKMGVIGKDKRFYDSTKAGLMRLKLSKEWKKFTIGVMGRDLTRIMTPFVFSVAGQSGPVVFYIDDIVYE